MSKSTIQQHLQLVASQMGASNNVTAGAVDKVRDSRVAKQAKDVASAAKQHIAGNGKKYSALAGVGAGAAGAYGANKLRSNEIQAGITDAAKTAWGAIKKAGKSAKAGYKLGREPGTTYEGTDKIYKVAKHLGANRNKYLAGAGVGAGVGAAVLKNRNNNQVSAMEYFSNITAAEYLEVKSKGTIANSITAADYAEYNKISAMEYLIQANEDSAELAEASDDIKEALANADTEEEVAEILDANNDVKEAHEEKAAELSDIANSDSDDADEAAALAEFHAGKAQEAEDVENDVISALYYNN